MTKAVQEIVVGNAAAMREALKEARRVLRKIYKPELSPLDGDNRLISATVGIINAALSAPARQCDVGTPEEQFKRFLAFCQSESRGCEHCPANMTRLRGTSNCDLAWAQMPYVAQEGGEE